jgi:hypothetical protein
MSKYEQIKALEAKIATLKDQLSKIQSEPQTVKRGDYVIAIDSVEWAYTRGERYWVDSVSNGHIHVRSADPARRNNFVFWMSDSDWVKDERNT